jgi:hypothetical protein
MGFFFKTMAIVTTVSIIDENDDKIEVYVNTANEITITVDVGHTEGARPVAVLTPTDARALARLILDAAGLAEEEQEENTQNGHPVE